MKLMSKKRFAALLSIALLLTAAVGVTVAYLVDSTEPLVNSFTPASVGVTVTDDVTNNVKSNVMITNTGTTSAYIRARIVGSWVDSSGLVVRKWASANDGTFDGLPGSGWVYRKADGYYYYTTPVAPGGTTAPLFTSYTVNARVDGAHLEMDILMQAIQSEGGNTDGSAAKAAWGVDPSTLK